MRQGGVLSPVLFAILIFYSILKKSQDYGDVSAEAQQRLDSIVDKVKSTGLGCYFFSLYVSIFLYADDVLLIAPSVCSLQTLLDACDEELTCLDVQINTKKSVCIGIGARYNTECARLSLAQDGLLQWVSQCRYLGIYMYIY